VPPEGAIYWHAKVVELRCRLVRNTKPDELSENDVITYTIYSAVWHADLAKVFALVHWFHNVDDVKDMCDRMLHQKESGKWMKGRDIYLMVASTAGTDGEENQRGGVFEQNNSM
jgi:hypothetical protein